MNTEETTEEKTIPQIRAYKVQSVLNFFNKFHCNFQNVMFSSASHSGMHIHMVGKISRSETGLPGFKFHSLTS